MGRRGRWSSFSRRPVPSQEGWPVVAFLAVLEAQKEGCCCQKEGPRTCQGCQGSRQRCQACCQEVWGTQEGAKAHAKKARKHFSIAKKLMAYVRAKHKKCGMGFVRCMKSRRRIRIRRRI